MKHETKPEMKAEVKPIKLEKSHKVTAKNLVFLSIQKKDMKRAMRDFEETTIKLEEFLRTLERKFHQVIWYIGTDILENNIVERFIFHRQGFMEIAIKDKTELKAYFPEKEQAEKFAKALKKTAEKLGRIKSIK